MAKLTQDEYDTLMRRLTADVQSAGTAYREAQQLHDYAYGRGVDDDTTRRAYLEARERLDRARYEMQNLRVNRERLVEPGVTPDQWEEDPATAARYDRNHWNRED